MRARRRLRRDVFHTFQPFLRFNFPELLASYATFKPVSTLLEIQQPQNEPARTRCVYLSFQPFLRFNAYSTAKGGCTARYAPVSTLLEIQRCVYTVVLNATIDPTVSTLLEIQPAVASYVLNALGPATFQPFLRFNGFS